MKKFITNATSTAVLLAFTAPAVMAQTGPAQPDASDASAYITAGAATILAVFGGKYVLRGVMLVARWVGSAIGR